MKTPNKKDIKEFIRIVNKLSGFESTQRLIRGHGAFEEKELPNKSTIIVLNWLRRICEKKDK